MGDVKGFTLIELMMSLAISAIVLTVAIPNFANFSQNSRVTSQTNELIMAINLARGEAAKRGARVALCRSSDLDDSPTCGGSNYNWGTGWLVYAVGTDRSLPLYKSTAPENDILLAKGMAETGIDILSAGGANQNLEFNADGSTNEGGSTAYFAVCDSRGADFGKLVTIFPTGRPQLSDATDCSP